MENITKQKSVTDKNARITGLIFIFCLPVILSLIIAAYFPRLEYLPIFMQVGTADFSAIKLFHAITDQKAMLSALIPYLLEHLFLGYFLGTLMIIPAVILLYISIKRLKSNMDPDTIIASLLERMFARRKILLAAGAVVVAVLMILSFFYLLAGRPVSTDEFAYNFQADLMKHFRLYAPEPAYPEYYQCENIVMKDGKWYSKYTVGFPGLLAIGCLLKAPWLVNPLIMIFTLYMLFLFTRRVFDDRTAWLAIFLAVLSPFFFYNGSAAFQPHISLAGALLAASYFYLLTLDGSRWYYPALTAAFFTLGALIRPVDAALWAAAFIPLSIYFLATRNDRGRLFLRYLIMLASGLAGMAVILFINKAQTGEFFKFAFHSYQSKEIWGMGAYEHNIFRAAWNTLYSLARVITWGPVLFFEMALLSLWGGKKKQKAALWVFFLIFVGFFFGWYAIGHFEYGPRYLFTGFVMLLPVAASGISFLFDIFRKKTASWKTASASFLAVFLLFSLAAVFPPFFPLFKQQVSGNAWVDLFRKGDAVQRGTAPAKIAVFAANAAEHRVNNSTRNLYPLKDDKVLYLLFLEPEKNRELLEKQYPDRVPFITFFNPATNKYSFEPYPTPDKITPALKSQYYMLAGLAYRFGVERQDKAREFWLKSYETDGNNIGAIMNLANMLKEEGDMDESKYYWEMVLKANPDIDITYFSLGGIYEFRKEYNKAEKFYLEYIRRTANQALKQKAVERVLYYRKNGSFPPMPAPEEKKEPR